LNKTMLAINGNGLTRAARQSSGWQLSSCLLGMRVNCLVSDPHQPGVVYAGTQNGGVLRSGDAGKTWESIGMEGIPVKSLAVSPHQRGVIYAGCKPAALYFSENGGKSWQELEGLRQARRWWWFSPADPPGLDPYVIALTVSPEEEGVIMAGIEAGGVLRSEDGGRSWSGHRRGAVLDCHSLKFHHANGKWVYQAGAGGAAISRDGGVTWKNHRPGLNKKYGWMVASDPQKPDVWYVSASPLPNPFKGEFNPPAHVDGRANASLYRSVDGAPWQELGGGLPSPLNSMPYALVTHTGETGHLTAGLSNGEVWHSTDYGDNLTRLPFEFDGIRDMIVIAE
jgi:hypothetical protein